MGKKRKKSEYEDWSKEVSMKICLFRITTDVETAGLDT